MIRYFPTTGDRHGWAIDEDLRLIRRALQGLAKKAWLPSADLVHSPYWPSLSMHEVSVLRSRFVMAQADNPPFFYLTQPAFFWGQSMVDLWVARSNEAHEQFAALGLNSVHIPYAIDGKIFFPIKDRAALCKQFNIPASAYIIGNFHRDTEGADLLQPKMQKSPEMMVAILRELKSRGVACHVLLAGPRRHWIRRALTGESIPFTFIGRQGIEEDDYAVNILPREKLNELYNVCDLYLISSRWEGGPQSAMEAAAARTKILSTPLGVARDILQPESLYSTVTEAVDKIASDVREGTLQCTLDAQESIVRRDHTDVAMTLHLQRLYGELPSLARYREKAVLRRSIAKDSLKEAAWRLRRRLQVPRLPVSVCIDHAEGLDESLDECVAGLRRVVEGLGIQHRAISSGPLIMGAGSSCSANAKFRLLPEGGRITGAFPHVCHIAMSVQDAVNFRKSNHRAPVLVCPLIFEKSATRQPDTLVVEAGDLNASRRILKAMLDGAVPVYPDGTAYYYQVFHGGISHGKRNTTATAEMIAVIESETFRSLSCPPSFSRAVSFWRDLLAV